ncbi:hypothetical protein [Nocardioides yefusunii]|uniref:Uncharacterized protein n=1 Tax=Nocardioides yefusunii TaxID=2500546 RepID=A0ABW1QVH0_9ACTN|nr:hypothetical protein [Nocardioides yefusunii]
MNSIDHSPGASVSPSAHLPASATESVHRYDVAVTRLCFVAASANFPVRHVPEVFVGTL